MSTPPIVLAPVIETTAQQGQGDVPLAADSITSLLTRTIPVHAAGEMVAGECGVTRPGAG
jgi:hypothetical protein